MPFRLCFVSKGINQGGGEYHVESLYLMISLWAYYRFSEIFMDIISNPPQIGKHHKIDAQFDKWQLFVNKLGAYAFVFFLSCLGTSEHKYLCAALSWLLLAWCYAVGRKKFPVFIVRLRKEGTASAKTLEKSIWSEHLYKKPQHFFPFFLGFSTLGFLAAWPVFSGGCYVYTSLF